MNYISYSWQGITANGLACAFMFVFRKRILDFYVTLHSMNNPIVTVVSWLFVISIYALIHKSVLATFAFFSKIKAQKAHKKAELLRHENIKQNFMTLSKKEIAILKFVLSQDWHSAWLPDNYKPIMILIKKGYLVQIGSNSKSISSLRYMFDYSCAHLFTVPDNIQQLISQMPQEFSRKWRKTKPDWSFQECQ